MTDLKHIASIIAIACGCMALAILGGQSEQAGLLGAIIGVGFYAASVKESK